MTQVAIQLSDELNQFVQKSVETGAFHDADEFFASLLYNIKVQSEDELTEDEQRKLYTLRSDIQEASAQLDRGEGVRDFDYEAFLAERHLAYSTTRPD